MHRRRSLRRPMRRAAFAPTQASDLRLWLKADAGVSPGATFTWADQSGLANNATQSVGANQPSFSATSAAWGGRPCLTFGAAKWLLANGIGPMIDGDHLPLTISCAVRHDALSVFSGYASWDAAAGTQNFFRCYIDPTIGAAVSSEHDSTSPGIDINAQTATGTDTTPHVITTIYSGIDVSIFIDGITTSVSNAAMNPPAATHTTTFTVGNLLRGFFGTQGLIGDLAEMVVYARALSPGERVGLDAYMKGRWGI